MILLNKIKKYKTNKNSIFPEKCVWRFVF